VRGDGRWLAALQAGGLAIAAAGNAIVGGWAAARPRDFYDNFPGAGHHWVAANGPYDEHLVLDVGWLSLALALVLLAALWRREVPLVRIATLAALVFAAPHLIYHARHRDALGGSDAVLEIVSLAIAVAAPLIALISTFVQRRSRAYATYRRR
jgi:MFS family permease